MISRDYNFAVFQIKLCASSRARNGSPVGRGKRSTLGACSINLARRVHSRRSCRCCVQKRRGIYNASLFNTTAGFCEIRQGLQSLSTFSTVELAAYGTTRCTGGELESPSLGRYLAEPRQAVSNITTRRNRSGTCELSAADVIFASFISYLRFSRSWSSPSLSRWPRGWVRWWPRQLENKAGRRG